MTPDPTGARMRTLNSFFHSPRFPIKELPDDARGGGHDDDGDHDHDDDRVRLEGWNAYVGAPGRER